MSASSSGPGATPQKWGAGQLTREELRTLAVKLHNATDASLQRASTCADSGQMDQHFDVACEMSQLRSEVADQLIVHGLGPEAATAARQAAREAEAEQEAWGWRGPSASYEEWLAEGQDHGPDPEAGQ